MPDARVTPKTTPRINPDDVIHVARLARLAIPPEQIPKLTGELESILEYVARIGEVELDDFSPMAHPLPLTNVLRDDVATPGLSIEQVLRNAQETDGRFFKVPKIIGASEESAG